MKTLLLNAADFPIHLLQNLLSQYILDDFHIKSINPGIDLNELANFEIANIRYKMEIGGKIWQVVDDDNKTVAIFGLTKSEARSRNFDINYWELTPIYNFTKDADKILTSFENEVLHQEIIDHNIEYLKVKINASDYRSLAAFSKLNYSFIGTSLNFFLNEKHFRPSLRKLDHLEVINMTEDMMEVVRDLLLNHTFSEDFYDLDLFVDKTYVNFYNWLKNRYLTLNGREHCNTEMILLRDKIEDAIVGFCCYTKEGDFSRKFSLNLITRDITVIEKKYHGRGYGEVLFAEVMKRERKNVELKTMANNYQAMQFNQKVGFKCVSCHHFFKKRLKKQV